MRTMPGATDAIIPCEGRNPVASAATGVVGGIADLGSIAAYPIYCFPRYGSCPPTGPIRSDGLLGAARLGGEWPVDWPMVRAARLGRPLAAKARAMLTSGTRAIPVGMGEAI